MFNSNISASDLIEDLKSEVDIAIPIPNRSYVTWLNALEGLLYSECIKEQHELILKGYHSEVETTDLECEPDADEIRFEDIYTVYADDRQLIKSTLTSGNIFPDTYYKSGEKIKFNIPNETSEIRIVYFIRPAHKTVDADDDVQNGDIMIPVEFMDLVKAKLRGEAYKVANEDALAAKWLNDYNVLLENFKLWLSEKAPEFGM